MSLEDTLDLFEKDCLHEYLQKISTSKNDQIENRVIKLEENVHKILKLLEEAPVNSNDDWGEEIDTNTEFYENILIENDQYAGRERKSKRETNNISSPVKLKDTRRTNVSARVMSARMRHESAKVRESISGMQDKLESLEERTSKSLERVEQALDKIQRDDRNRERKKKRN